MNIKFPRILIRAAAVAAVLASTGAIHAEEPYFLGLGELPGGNLRSEAYDISSDGAVVVGLSNTNPGDAVYRWTRAAGLINTGIINGGIPRISSDGATIVTTTEGRRWTLATGADSVPLQFVRGVSGDGSIIVGNTYDLLSGERQAARWTAVSGVEPLFGELPSSSIAWDVSADGSTILATDGPEDMFSTTPFVWSAADGYTYLGGSDFRFASSFYGISDDGTTVVGDRTGGAYRWTKATGVTNISLLPDGVVPATARGVSADGTVVVGNTNSNPQRPYIWDIVHGSRYLQDVMEDEAGLENALLGWNLGFARGVSGDGRHIVGYGTNPAGNTEAWIVYLGVPVPEPNSISLLIFAIAVTLTSWRCRSSIKFW